MITNPVLAEKNRVQSQLVEASGYDMKKYSELIHQIVLDMQAQYGLKLNYVVRKDGIFQPLPRGMIVGCVLRTISGNALVRGTHSTFSDSDKITTSTHSFKR